METRYWVLDLSLDVESLLSDLFKDILRITKPSTKTLDNKSTTLSYKAKIDLLHDLGDLSNAEYNVFVKFSEIRNQFIHNRIVDHFIKLPDEPKKFLKREFLSNGHENEELNLKSCFNDLQASVRTKLTLLKEEYAYGVQLDYEKYIALQLNRRMDDILERTKQEFEYDKAHNQFTFIDDANSKSDVEIFIQMVKRTLNSEQINIHFEVPKEELL